MQTDIVGRGSDRGYRSHHRLVRQARSLAKEGRGAAYVFVMGSFAEVLRSFDFPIVFPEINSLQTAARKVAHEFLTVAEDYGYSPDICGYVKADVGVQLGGRQHPAAEIPKPALAVLTNACNTYIKWAEIWERFYDTRVFTLDIPGSRSETHVTEIGSEDFERDRRYVEGQIHELIATCEELTGQSLDTERLCETLGYTNRMNTSWAKLVEFNRARPAPFSALTDGTVYLGVSNALRGTEAGALYFEDLVEEMEYKTSQAIGTTTEEHYRLAFVGVPCYPIFRRFNEMFNEWGGQFVASTYLWFASGGSQLGYQYDLDRPIESLAAGTLLSVRDAMDTYVPPEPRPRAHDRRLRARRRRLPPHQELSHRVDRLGRQPALSDGGTRHPLPLPRVRHDGQARRLRSADEEPHRRLLRGPGGRAAARSRKESH